MLVFQPGVARSMTCSVAHSWKSTLNDDVQSPSDIICEVVCLHRNASIKSRHDNTLIDENIAVDIILVMNHLNIPQLRIEVELCSNTVQCLDFCGF